MNPSDYLNSLVGSFMPGGCDDCGAIQTMTKDAVGVYVLTIEHDLACPMLAKIKGRSR